MTVAGGCTVVFVVYGTERLELHDLPPGTDVVIVHNDDRLTAVDAPPSVSVTNVRGHGNVGFGAGANLGLARVRTERVVFCNPDTTLGPEHWKALFEAPAGSVVSVPMVDGQGRPGSVVNAYPTPLALALTAWRVGRIAARGSSVRRTLTRLLGRWGSAHSGFHAPGCVPLREAWCSGAVFSVDAERLRAVGGFDDGYFLYYEDVDLCRRLAGRFPTMSLCVADVAPAVHLVGGSATSKAGRRAVDLHLARSARRFASAQEANRWSWKITRGCVALREAWLRPR